MCNSEAPNLWSNLLHSDWLKWSVLIGRALIAARGRHVKTNIIAQMWSTF